MGADNIDTPPPADSPVPGSDESLRGPNAGPRRDEGTPATELDLGHIQDIEPVHRASEGPDAGPYRDEGTPATELDLGHIQDIEPVHRPPEGQEMTPDDYRREAAASYARAGSAYHEADRIIEGDRTQGWAARAEDAIVKASEELAAGHRDSGRADQAERFSLENETRGLLAQARELERNGDADGAAALRNEADAKQAEAFELGDRMLDQLSKAQAHESQLADAWNGKTESYWCEQAATLVENIEALGPMKDVAAAGLRAMGHMLEVYGPEGLRDMLGDFAQEVRAKLPQAAITDPDTKTQKSRGTIELPERAADALSALRKQRAADTRPATAIAPETAVELELACHAGSARRQVGPGVALYALDLR